MASAVVNLEYAAKVSTLSPARMGVSLRSSRPYKLRIKKVIFKDIIRGTSKDKAGYGKIPRSGAGGESEGGARAPLS